MIALSLKPSNFNEYLSAVKYAEKYGADLIELRLEKFYGSDFYQFCKDKSFSKIITIKPFDYSSDECLRIMYYYFYAIKTETEYLDIDIRTEKEIIEELIKLKMSTKIILSYHNYHDTQSFYQLKKLFDKMMQYKADLIKMVCYANNLNDNLKMLKLLEYAKSKGVKLIAHCLGPHSKEGRILSLKNGSEILYSSYSYAKETAEGQMELSILSDIFNIKRINSDTKVFGIVGYQLFSSKSWIYHNLCYQLLRINAIFLNFEIENFDSFYSLFSKYLEGLSVTMPYKEIVAKKKYSQSGEVKLLGSANTISKSGRKEKLYNTDFMGFSEIVKREEMLHGKNILIIGAGGSARAIIKVMMNFDNKVFCMNRSPERAKILCDEFGSVFIDEPSLKNFRFEAVINTTPYDNDFLLKNIKKIFKKKSVKIIVDIALHSFDTKFVTLAKENEIKVINGFDFFVAQAEIQFKLLTGQEPDKNILEKQLLENFTKRY